MPCRGCYGPPEGVVDQGAKLLSAIGALIDTEEPALVQPIMNTIVDPAGLSYRFGLANSLMNELKYKKSEP
jgi:F420-non-reducing hydrogenase small subunit